jgi:hypothetical protein
MVVSRPTAQCLDRDLAQDRGLQALVVDHIVPDDDASVQQDRRTGKRVLGPGILRRCLLDDLDRRVQFLDRPTGGFDDR